MKIEIEKKELLSILSKAQNVVEKKNLMPILVNVLLDANNNSLQIFATDLEVSVTDKVQAKVQTQGKVAISAKNLFEIVKELNDGPISLNKRENNWLEIKQNKYSSKIVGVSAEEYPIFPVYEGENFIKVNAKLLSTMIDKTIYCVSVDDTRYHLNGIFLEKSVKSEQINFKMVATDGHRLAVVEKGINPADKTNSELPTGVIIPKKGINEIRKLLEQAGTDVELTIEGSQLVVKSGSAIVMIRLIEGKYPNYTQLIPQKTPNQALIKKADILSSLKRVSLLANQKSKGITFAFSSGKLEISSNNPELGDAKEEMEVNYNGPDIKIGFNAKYLTDIFLAIEDELVDFKFNDQLSPGLVRPHNDPSYTCVIMPMRI